MRVAVVATVIEHRGRPGAEHTIALPWWSGPELPAAGDTIELLCAPDPVSAVVTKRHWTEQGTAVLLHVELTAARWQRVANAAALD